MKVVVMGLVILTAVLKIKADEQKGPLKCWHCSSDTIGAEDFCGIEFKESNIPDVLKEKNLSVLRTCNSSINSDHVRNVCRKTVEDINGKIIVKRFCYYTNKSDSLEHCQQETKNVNRVFCQDCLTEKCNAAFKFNLSASILTANILILFIAKQLQN